MIANLLWTTLRVLRRDNARSTKPNLAPFLTLLLQQQARLPPRHRMRRNRGEVHLLTTLHKGFRVRVVPIESVYKAIRSALRKLDAALLQYERKTIRR
jgi:hypothetical protein